ncbi:zinc finger, SWIM-type containing protein, partial [Tanacetum coccineum]
MEKMLRLMEGMPGAPGMRMYSKEELMRENNALFSLKIHYASMFTNPPNRSYVNGDFCFFDCIDIDEFSVLKVVIWIIEYVRLGNRVIEVYVEHHTSTLDTYYQSQQVTEISTPKNSCIIEAPDDVIPAKRPNKLPPKKFGKSACARNLLGWNEIRDRLGVGQSSQVTEVGQSSQSNPTPIVQPSAFVDDFYAVNDPFNGQGNFEPLFRLDDITPFVNVDGIVKGKGKAIEVDVGDKGKGITIDDKIKSLEDAEDEEQSSEEEESDGFVDVENPVEEVEVNMDSFDRTDDDNIGYEQNPREFNANDEIEVDMDVMDPDEFESASDEDGKEFATADDVKKDIHKLSIETRRELFLKKNDKVRVRAECRGTIPVFRDTPQHGPSDGGPSQASGSSPKTKWTKAKVNESKETNPEIPIKSLQEQLQKKFQLEVSRMKAFRAKSKVVDSVRGDYTLQYKMLRDYVMELKECNPN